MNPEFLSPEPSLSFSDMVELRHSVKDPAGEKEANYLRSEIENYKDGDDFYSLMRSISTLPEIIYQLQMCNALTLDAYGKFAETGDPNDLKEYPFSISSNTEKTKIFPTEFLEKPAAFDMSMDTKDINSSDEKRLTLANVHAHPPMGDILVPSVVEEVEGELKGDLYSLVYARKYAREGEIAERMLQLIMQSDFEREVVKLLWIRESEESLKSETDEELIQKLKDNKERIYASVSEEECVSILESIGFQAEYMEVPEKEFFSMRPISTLARAWIEMSLGNKL